MKNSKQKKPFLLYTIIIILALVILALGGLGQVSRTFDLNFLISGISQSPGSKKCQQECVQH